MSSRAHDPQRYTPDRKWYGDVRVIITRVGNELYWEAELVLRQYLNSVDLLSCQLAK